MQPALFDSSIYISALRKEQQSIVAARRLSSDAPIWISAVVLEELYAGSTDRHPAAVERLERDFRHAGRILVPTLGDWAQAGRVLSRIATKYDYEQIGRGRMTNDALIAISAGRAGIRVITANERDFGKLAEFYRFRWEVAKL